MMNNKKVLDVLAVFTGFFFLVSGVGKVINTAAFGYLIQMYGFGNLMFISPLIVLIELWVGIHLFLLIRPKINSLLALILLIIFTAAFAYAHFKNGVNDCGCMGAILPTKMPTLLSFLRNLLLIVFVSVVWLKYPHFKDYTAKWKRYLVIACMSAALFFAGNSYTLPKIFQRKDVKQQLKNNLVQNTALGSFIKTTPGKTYLVFCFSYTCPHCWNSIENLRHFIRTDVADSVIVFGMGEATDREYFMQNFKPDFQINDISHENMIKLTTFYPTSFYIRNDSIKAVLPGVLLSPITFKKYYIEADFRLF
jgi:hypothetical protein